MPALAIQQWDVKAFSPVVDHLSVDLVMLTPALAEKFLTYNKMNRRESKMQISSLAEAIRAGEWEIINSGVAFCGKRMIDAQGRCKAVIDSGIAVPILVIRGLTTGAQSVIDTGRKRSAADALRLDGFDGDPTQVAAIARIALHWSEGKLTRVRHNVNRLRIVRNKEVQDWYHHNQDVIDAVTIGNRVNAGWRRTPPSAIGFAYLLCARIDYPLANQFFDEMRQTIMRGDYDPIKRMHNAYDELDKRGIRPRQTGHLAIMFTAWNARRCGQQLRKKIVIMPTTDPNDARRVLEYPSVPEPL